MNSKPKHFVFLSDNNDPYIHMLASGVGGTITPMEQFRYADSNQPIVMRSILKYKIMNRCRIERRDFYYVDTGYFGNNVNRFNPRGLKLYHRIVKNGLQHTTLRNCDNQRLRKIDVALPNCQSPGDYVLIVAPGHKACKHYGIKQQEWIDQTMHTVKQHTNRPVLLRKKIKNRAERITDQPIQDQIAGCHAVVTYNSIAGVESILAGKPAFVLCADNAALPVANTDLAKIEKPFYPDKNLIYTWACRLSYGQFSTTEMRSGSVWQHVL